MIFRGSSFSPLGVIAIVAANMLRTRLQDHMSAPEKISTVFLSTTTSASKLILHSSNPRTSLPMMLLA